MCFRSDQEEWLTQSVHSTIVPVGVSCHAVHYCSRKGLQLDVTVEGFLPSGLHSTSQLTECQLVERELPAQFRPCFSVLCLQNMCVFSNRVLLTSYDGQFGAVVMTLIALVASVGYLTNS